MKLKTDEFNKTPTQIVQKSHKAKIDKSAANLVMDMLSKIYAEPLAAAIREYVSNGIDSHTKALQTKAVDVHLPTRVNPVLRVTDYGAGLDYFDILTVYANFGTSDKRESDAFIGGFGIGSKSGLAISDMILINSVKDKTYNKFILERTPDGIVTRFIVENQNTDKQNGTTVEINVNQAYLNLSIEDMQKVFVSTLAGWSKDEVYASIDDPNIAAIINDCRIPDTWTRLNAGFITNGTLSDKKTLMSGALVGNVLYKDITNLVSELINEGSTKYEILNKQPFVVQLDIAQTRVSYSREKLLYKDDINTRNHIVAQLDKLVDEFHERIESIKGLNLPARDYLRRIEASGVNTRELRNYAKDFIYKTDAFDLTNDIAIHHRHLSFRGRSCSFTLSNSTINEKIETMLHKGALLLTNNPNEIDSVSKRMASDVVRAATNIDSTDADIIRFQKYVESEYYVNVFFMSYQDASMLPLSHKMIRLDYADLVDARKKLNKINRQSNKNRSLYSYSGNGSVNLIQMEDSYLDSMQMETLLVPPTSDFTFNTQNRHAGLSILRTYSDFNTIFTTRTQRDFAELQKRMPLATSLSDNEIMYHIENQMRPYVWAAEDWVCQIFMEINKQVKTHDHIDVRVDVYKELGLDFNSCIVPHGITPDYIKSNKQSLLYLQNGHDIKLQTMFANIDLDACNPTPHEIDTDVKILHLIAGSGRLGSITITEFDEAELKDLIARIKTKFAYQIDMLNSLYDSYN